MTWRTLLRRWLRRWMALAVPLLSCGGCFASRSAAHLPMDITPAAIKALGEIPAANVAAIMAAWPSREIAWDTLDFLENVKRRINLKRTAAGDVTFGIVSNHDADLEGVGELLGTALGTALKVGAAGVVPGGQQAPPEAPPVVNAPAADLRNPFPAVGRPARVDRPQPMKGTDYGVACIGK